MASLALVLAAVLASPADPERPSPGAFIERPLVLPAGAVQPQLGWELAGYRAGGPVQNGLWLGADAGVAGFLQIGVAAVLTEAPDLGFDRATARGLFSLHPDAAIRLDTSVYRFRGVGSTEYGYASGIGLSLRLPVVRGVLSLISGRAFGLPPIARTLDEAHFADDLFTLDLNHSNVTATVGLPVGLQLQATEEVALLLRSGFRHGFGGGNYDENWVPVGVDVLFNLSPVDLIGSAELPGNLRTHADVIVVRVVAQARF